MAAPSGSRPVPGPSARPRGAPSVLTTLLFAGAGLLLGAWTGDGFGAAVGAAFGWVLARLLRLETVVARLEAAVAALERDQASLAARSAAPSPADDALAALARAPVALADAPVAPEPPTASASPVAPLGTLTATSPAFVPLDATHSPEATAATVAAAPTRPVDTAPAIAGPTPPRPPVRPARPNPLEPLRAWFFGGNTIVKAGVAILFVGLAFLARYAAEHTDVPIEFRLAGIAGVALALLVVGWRLRTKRAGYAQVLQGGAVAVLYLVLFAGFRLYGVIGVGAAFAGMALVAALAAALAILQDARSLAVVGAVGGFAAPLLVSTGQGNVAALFAYYLVLDVAVAAIAWWKRWRPLVLVAFAFTWIVAGAWGVLRYTPEDYATGQGFLVAFVVVFLAMLLGGVRKGAIDAARHGSDRAATGAGLRSGDTWVDGTLLFGLPTVAFALQAGLVHDTTYGVALSALAFGALYVGLAWLLKTRRVLSFGDGRTAFDASLAVATVFATLVIPFALDARGVAGAWTLEAAALLWVGFRQQRALPRVFGYALFLLSSMAMANGWDRHGLPLSVWNAYLWNGVLAGAAAIAGALVVRRAVDRGAAVQGEDVAEPALVVLGSLWFVAATTLTVSLFVPPEARDSVSLAVAAAVALGYAALAARFRWTAIAWAAATLAPIALLVAVAQALDLGAPVTAVPFGNPLAGGGWWAWPLAAAAFVAVLRWAGPRWPPALAHATHATGALATTLVAAGIGQAATAALGDGATAWPIFGWLAVPALVLLLLPQRAFLARWPMREQPAAWSRTAAAVIAAWLVLWSLGAAVFSDGSAPPLPHVPLVNPLDLAIGLALFAVLRLVLATPAATPGASRWRTAPIAVLSAVAFVWLNTILVRAFHHWAGVPWTLDGWVDSLAVQTGLTLLWTVLALATTWIAARRRLRTPWLVGAGLLAAVVVKLLLVDLAGSGTVTRIVSFIGVGALMLVIGYVAPLPSASARQNDDPAPAL